MSRLVLLGSRLGVGHGTLVWLEASWDECALWDFYDGLLSQPGQLSAIDCIREVKATLLVEPAGQKPNTLNPDLV